MYEVILKKLSCIVFSFVTLSGINNASADTGTISPYPEAVYQDYDTMPEYNPPTLPTPFPSVVSSPNCPTIRVCKWIPVYFDEETGEIYHEEVCYNKKMC